MDFDTIEINIVKYFDINYYLYQQYEYYVFLISLLVSILYHMGPPTIARWLL